MKWVGCATHMGDNEYEIFIGKHEEWIHLG
jgi:hypothetical protein